MTRQAAGRVSYVACPVKTGSGSFIHQAGAVSFGFGPNVLYVLRYLNVGEPSRTRDA